MITVASDCPTDLKPEIIGQPGKAYGVFLRLVAAAQPW